MSAIETAATESDKGRGAAKRFSDFLVAHDPGPPPERAPWTSIDWSDLRALVMDVYDRRSRALHNGRPFPEPMLRSPRWESNIKLFLIRWIQRITEVIGTANLPDGIVTFAHDATSSNDEIPMLLWVFEHLVRGALTDWWGQVQQGAGVGEEVNLRGNVTPRYSEGGHRVAPSQWLTAQGEGRYLHAAA